MSAAGAAAVLAPGARALAKTATSGPADTVFLGGSVITMDGRRRIAKAMAVSYGRIVYVGDVAVFASALAPGASTAAAPAADIPKNLRRVVRNSVTSILLGRPTIIATAT